MSKARHETRWSLKESRKDYIITAIFSCRLCSPNRVVQPVSSSSTAFGAPYHLGTAPSVSLAHCRRYVSVLGIGLRSTSCLSIPPCRSAHTHNCMLALLILSIYTKIKKQPPYFLVYSVRLSSAVFGLTPTTPSLSVRLTCSARLRASMYIMNSW
jgi:hypothetical protein